MHIPAENDLHFYISWHDASKVAEGGISMNSIARGQLLDLYVLNVSWKWSKDIRRMTWLSWAEPVWFASAFWWWCWQCSCGWACHIILYFHHWWNSGGSRSHYYAIFNLKDYISSNGICQDLNPQKHSQS